MLFENHYYINVSRGGKLLFKVDPIYYPNQDILFDLISSNFSKREGYRVSLFEVKCSGFELRDNQ